MQGASGPTSRKSSNGTAPLYGEHCQKSWSTTPSVVALSSGEAEYYGVVMGGSVLLGAIGMAKDLGTEANGRIYTDSSAAKGISNRSGLGKTRHIHTNYLWIQEHLHNKDFQLLKVGTNDNVGDLFSKYV